MFPKMGLVTWCALDLSIFCQHFSNYTKQQSNTNKACTHSRVGLKWFYILDLQNCDCIVAQDYTYSVGKTKEKSLKPPTTCPGRLPWTSGQCWQSDAALKRFQFQHADRARYLINYATWSTRFRFSSPKREGLDRFPNYILSMLYSDNYTT